MAPEWIFYSGFIVGATTLAIVQACFMYLDKRKLSIKQQQKIADAVRRKLDSSVFINTHEEAIAYLRRYSPSLFTED